MSSDYTKEQRDAIEHDGNFIVITAGAGSGKTRVLIERICRLLKEKKASLAGILAVTFTEKAAAELKERLARVINNDLAVANAYIGTIHSFCARMLREHAPLLGLDPDFNVLEEHSSGIILATSIRESLLSKLAKRDSAAERLVEELGLKNAIDCISELIRYRWHTERLSTPSDLPDNDLARADEELRDAAIYCYNECLKDYNAAKWPDLDFQDLEIMAIKLLGDGDAGKRYKKRFSHIFVDEFQDINDTQARIIELLHGKKNSLTVVGDTKQSIYRFRGADLHEFEKAIKRAEKVVHLGKNFRSTLPILSFINGLFPSFEPLTTDDTSISPDVMKIEISSDEEANADERRMNEAKAIAEAVKGLSGRTACLFSSLSSLKIYEKAFADSGLSYAVYGGHGFLDRSDVVDTLNMLRTIHDRTDAPALLGVARSGRIGITDDEIFIMCSERDENGKQDIERLYQKIYEHEKSSFLRKMAGLAPFLSVSELIRNIGGRSENIEKLANIASMIEENEPLSLGSFLDHIRSLRSGKNKIADFPDCDDAPLLLMTIHQAKGLQFDNVILADTIRLDQNDTDRWKFVRGAEGGLAFKVTPFDNPEADPEPSPFFERLKEIDRKEEEAERERLLYVALTRAEKRLIIPLHPGTSRHGPWHKLLLEKCRDIPAMRDIRPVSGTCKPPSPDDGTPADLRTHRPVNRQTVLTATMLEDFATCPRKYQMKYILGVPEGTSGGRSVKGLPASVHGDIVHKMIESRSRGILPKIGNICLEMEMEDSRITDDDRRQIDSQFKNFMYSGYGALKDAKHELPFFMRLGRTFIEGKIDMFISGASSWEIVDFKTGNRELSDRDVLERYRVQIDTYALAVAKATGMNNGRVTLLVLSSDGARNIAREISGPDLDRIEKELLSITDRILSLGQIDIKGCGNCYFCKGI